MQTQKGAVCVMKLWSVVKKKKKRASKLLAVGAYLPKQAYQKCYLQLRIQILSTYQIRIQGAKIVVVPFARQGGIS